MQLPFKKQLHAADELLDKCSGDGYTRGRAEQVVGGLLIADGLVGLENPMGGRKFRMGIMGATIGVLFGGAFLFGGIYMAQRIPGIVHDAGITEPGMVDQSLSTAGQSIFGMVEHMFVWILWFFAILGGLFLLGALGSLIRCVTELVCGGLLLRHGRKLVASNPAVPVDRVMADVTERFTQTLFQLGRGRFTRRQPAWGSASQGRADLPGGLRSSPVSSQPQDVAPPMSAASSAMPPPGWYAGSAGSTALEWWDGTQWTGHHQATSGS